MLKPVIRPLITPVDFGEAKGVIRALKPAKADEYIAVAEDHIVHTPDTSSLRSPAAFQRFLDRFRDGPTHGPAELSSDDQQDDRRGCFSNALFTRSSTTSRGSWPIPAPDGVDTAIRGVAMS
jgi:hypothetical protein